MKNKGFSIAAIVLTALVIVFGVLGNVILKADVFAVINPILFIAAIGCGYFAFKDDVSFGSKFIWLAAAIVFADLLTEILCLFGEIYRIIGGEEFSVLLIIGCVMGIAGCGILLTSLLFKSTKKIMPIGFGLLALNSILYMIVLDTGAARFFVFIAYILLILIAVNCLPRVNTLFRWLVIAFAIFTIEGLGFVSALALIVLALLMVPMKKGFVVNAAILVAILCIITAVAAPFAMIESHPFFGYARIVEYAESFSGMEMTNAIRSEITAFKVEAFVRGILTIGATLLAVAALVFMTIFLLKKKFGLLSCIMMIASSLVFMLNTTARETYWNFDVLRYPFISFVSSPHFWSIVTVALVSQLILKETKVVKIRVFAIISAIIMALLCIANEGNYIFVLYAFTMICIAFYLVPCVFTEYNSIAKVIFFTIITLGIWNLIWVFNVTKNLNKVEATANRKPVTELLLCMFLPLYYIYWLYKTAENVELYGAQSGKQFRLSILCLAFSVIMPLLSVVLIQDKINSIVGKAE